VIVGHEFGVPHSADGTLIRTHVIEDENDVEDSLMRTTFRGLAVIEIREPRREFIGRLNSIGCRVPF
jgi:hypothetical protein